MKRCMTKVAAGGVGLILLLAVIGNIPTTGLEGVNEDIKVLHMPLWEKVARFYLRHREFQRWAEAAAGGETDPQRRILRLMDWTRQEIKPMPPGLPFVDDHISHIVLRHYGNDGQMAEVFTALTSYTGNEGRWEAYRPPGATERLALSFVESDGKWWVLDVLNGAWFETQAGRIAAIEDFKNPGRLQPRGGAPASLGGVAYLDYYGKVDEVFRRSYSRAKGQMPWRRLLMELRLVPDDDEWRPPGNIPS